MCAVATNVCAMCCSLRACGGLREGNRAGSLASERHNARAGVRIMWARVYAGKDGLSYFTTSCPTTINA